ncbi:hypothetical protein PR048_005458 [Dryococelus australis]|uniref:Uncharacterized protein n=1 Tax=Dryococelus australis TaxID=614101 RepID=A0ABQ9I873_9NEOP|nr:hypothetical protein PR048_005458 [Dryococelus australis]
MVQAGTEEARLAVEGIDATVVADGAFAKISYKTTYNSLSGSKEAIFEVHYVPEMKANGLFLKILSEASRVSYHADSLIEDVDINCVELYNSHIAKAVGRKRINLCLRESYQASNTEADEDNGPDSAVPEMPLDQLKVAKEEYVKKLTSECIEEKRCDNLRTIIKARVERRKEEKTDITDEF